MARAVVNSGATAAIAIIDLLAIGLMQELQAAAFSVPDHISIVGLDDVSGVNFTTPG